MTKLEFILSLTGRLSHLPWEDVEERVSFYSEAIEDRIEEGLPEEEAVAAVGSPEEIAELIIAEMCSGPAQTPKKEQKRKLSAGEIVLLVLGSPLWLSLLIAAAAVVISVYVSLWAVIVSLWAVFASFAACVLGGIIGGSMICFINVPAGVFLIGAGIFLAGASVFLFCGCKAATKGAVALGGWVVRRLVKRRGA